LDYEAELAVVLGRRAHRVGVDRALDYVFGYTCGNDVTARDLQPQDGQWTYAKGFNTFCPLGPAINTEIANPEALPVEGVLNNKVVQAGNTADHLFPVAVLIEYISHCMTLLPGDVIMTGTPAGIGPLSPGDTFSVIIGGIGSLTNPVSK
jgi:2-keto-4-pentenoate hydratase/2-oxohepta-3-ene-1,7-dioic acid hydratase in catechol pathway